MNELVDMNAEGKKYDLVQGYCTLSFAKKKKDVTMMMMTIYIFFICFYNLFSKFYFPFFYLTFFLFKVILRDDSAKTTIPIAF